MESYQDKFSSSNNQMFDYETRLKKSKKAICIITDYLSDTKNLNLLDIGCSTGIMTNEYSKYFTEIIGIDIDKEAVEYAMKNFKKKNLTFLEGSYDSESIEMKRFDVITCSHIYEQVDSAEDLFDTIYKLLKPGGICYLVAGNRYKIIEPQFKLPFLSFLPGKIANLYLRVTKKQGEYYQKHKSLYNLKKLVRKFEIHDYTIETIRRPDKYSSDDLIKEGSYKQKIYILIAKIFYFLVPTYIWVLKKEVN